MATVFKPSFSKWLAFMFTLLLIMSDGCLGSWWWFWGPSKVRLSDIEELTFKEGKMTTGRRKDPIPQLNCIGGTASHMFKPDVITCYNNEGNNLYGSQWDCQAEMNSSYKIAYSYISCEGYDYPEDPFVLVGSCGLEYTINFSYLHFRNIWNLLDVLIIFLYLILAIIALTIGYKIVASSCSSTIPKPNSSSSHQQRRRRRLPNRHITDANIINLNWKSETVAADGPLSTSNSPTALDKRRAPGRTGSFWWDSAGDYCDSTLAGDSTVTRHPSWDSLGEVGDGLQMDYQSHPPLVPSLSLSSKPQSSVSSLKRKDEETFLAMPPVEKMSEEKFVGFEETPNITDAVKPSN